MKVSNGHINNLIEFLSSRKIDINILFEESGFDLKDLINPIGSVEDYKFLDFLNRSIRICDDDNFGLNYGCFLNLKSLGLILEISLSTSKIQQAISFLQEYLMATFPMVSISLKKYDDEFQLSLTSDVEDGGVRKHLLDSVYCVIYRELKLMLELRYSPRLSLPYIDNHPYRVGLGVADIEKGSGHHFYIPNEVLLLEINKKRIKQIESLLPLFMKELQLNDNSYGEMSKRVRQIMLNLSSPELPKIDQVINQLAVSKRSIQRELFKENTSYRKLANGIKQKMAFYLEQEGLYRTTDIAYILGYSEPSAYIHAKNNW